MRFAVISFQLYQTAKKSIKEGEKVLLVTNPVPGGGTYIKASKKTQN